MFGLALAHLLLLRDAFEEGRLHVALRRPRHVLLGFVLLRVDVLDVLTAWAGLRMLFGLRLEFARGHAADN